MEEKVIINEENTIPKEYKPLSTWAYFGYQLLFMLPFVGFILLIVFSFNNENINRRNFARSCFCMMLLYFILMIAVIIIFILLDSAVVIPGIDPI